VGTALLAEAEVMLMELAPDVYAACKADDVNNTDDASLRCQH
jgi:hypothetical protein